MGEHFITVCKECKEIITQCRCMVLDKAITYDVCDECKKKPRFTNEQLDAIIEKVRESNSPDCKHNWVAKNTGAKVLGADSYVCTKCPAIMDRQLDLFKSFPVNIMVTKIEKGKPSVCDELECD